MLAKRLVAGVAGVLALAVTARYTFGGAVVAAIGIVVASTIASRRGRRLSRAASWIGSVAAVWLVLIGALAFGASRLPAGSYQRMRQTMDSSQAHPAPPPAWLERIAPGSTARANARAAGRSVQMDGAFGVWALVIGAAFGTSMLATIVGTVGWLATLPLAYAFTGRWIGSTPNAPDETGQAIA